MAASPFDLVLFEPLSREFAEQWACRRWLRSRFFGQFSSHRSVSRRLRVFPCEALERFAVGKVVGVGEGACGDFCINPGQDLF